MSLCKPSDPVRLPFFETTWYPRRMHLSRASTGLAFLCASFCLAFETSSVHAQEGISPDKQWEFQYSDGVPRIVKAGTSEVVLDLSDVLPPSWKNGLTAIEEAEPVWASDSKRVAFNYRVPEFHSDGFGTTVLFELLENRWVFLRSPLDSKTVQAPDTDYNRNQLAQLAKKYLPKHSYNRAILEPPSTGDFLKVVSWTDSNTAVFWAFSADAEAGALFELKVDAKGNWKLVKTKVLSGKAAEKQQEGD
jgi:hypothetical protein